MPLAVKRDELLTRLKALARVIGRKKPGAILVRGEPGALMITWGDTTLEVPAEGTWKGVAKIPGSSIRFFSAMRPRGEVVQIREEPGRLCVDEDSVPCEWVEATPAANAPHDDQFVLSEEDWEFVRAMRSFLWKVLRSPGITPSAAMGLARALRGLELLPRSTPELEIQVDVQRQGTSRGITFEMEGGRLRG